ncbi:MAG: TonB-dependent receptor domain-containing protein, partial [Acidobacteriota bacterium]
NGFSAEFGNTPGLVMNNVTPSGTNDLHGSGSYRFRRTGMSSRPFNTSPLAIKAPTAVDDITAAIGGPILKDRWHFYGGYEWVTRDFSGRPAQTVTITEANKQALVAAGLSAAQFVSSIPASQKVNFFIFRTDAQLNAANRLTGRYIRFTNYSPNNIGGGLNTLERTVDLDDKSSSLAIQLMTVFSPTVFNEFRYQRANRKSQFLPTEFTPKSGPSITIPNVAQFGPATNLGTISPIETMNQFQNNLTWNNGDHSMKFGGGVNRVYDYRRNDISSVFTFPTLAAYLAARAGTNLRGYTNFAQTLGNAEITYNSAFYNFFAQDDWKVTRRLKLNYGLRYDLYDVPEGDANSPFEQGRNFRVDKNNFAPRLGFVYSLHEGSRPTVIRGSFGMYYDTVYLVMYENAIQGNGTGRYLNVTRTPTQTGAPDFPTTINGSLSSLGITQNAEVVSPDFKNMYAMHYQAQLEQALTNDLSVTLGYIHSNGRMIPVYRQINCRPVGTSLADGRPLYGTVAINATSGAATVTPCTNKVNAAFNNVIQVESGGTSNYDAMTLQFNKRFSQGYQFSVNYTLSKARDNAPERNLQGVGAVTQSDPSNREFDRGYGVADQRHTLSATFVARPKFNIESKSLAYLLNNNQLSFIATAGSGETFPITTNFDLNADGILNDIPVGYERNAGRSPAGVNVDFRFSRVIPITERFKLELMAEALNLFNINSTVTFTNTAFTANNINSSVVDPRTGAVVRALTPFIPTGQESRQGQIGVKLIF